MNCVDVGAHAGLFLRAFEKAAPGGRHSAVEPVAWKAALLRSKFPGVDIHQCALGKARGQASFSEILKKSGTSGLTEFAAPRDRDMGSRTYMIDVKTLDELTLNGPPIGMIKIDVEGAEGAVLLGAATMIQRDRPAILFESGAPAKGSESANDVFDLLRHRFDYRLTTVRNFVFGKSKIAGRDAFNYVRQYPATAYNFVALPN